jgi:hypothetical protein
MRLRGVKQSNGRFSRNLNYSFAVAASSPNYPMKPIARAAFKVSPSHYFESRRVTPGTPLSMEIEASARAEFLVREAYRKAEGRDWMSRKVGPNTGEALEPIQGAVTHTRRPLR